MRVRFLLGPAGSGKTCRCLEEIRLALQEPEGLPLLFLAPKQATFQLERQLLATPRLAGYTRLQILSFERLAEMVLHAVGGRPASAELLSEEGRLMVFRALLMKHQGDLEIFHASARLPGFARQASTLLGEWQRHHLGPGQLRQLAGRMGEDAVLGRKLRDLALLLEQYLAWMEEHTLLDANAIIDLAASAVEEHGGRGEPLLRFGGVWLDGFAEMTEQEVRLLAGIVPGADYSTLAFCLDHVPESDPGWMSIWSTVGQTFRRCWHRISGSSSGRLPMEVELLGRESGRSRFGGAPVLAHLEREWIKLQPQPWLGALEPVVLCECADPESEAHFVARRILRFVRDERGRFRDVAVVVRSLETYHAPLRRVFTRFGIPFFMDRREPISHHPLVELTRCAVRLAALGWQTEDWFGALKTGLALEERDDAQVDWLEREAWRRGWEGADWLEGLPRLEESIREKAEGLRQSWTRPCADFCKWLMRGGDVELGEERGLSREGLGITGAVLAEGLDRLWEDLGVSARLEEWAEAAEVRWQIGNPVHRTVWEQMQTWRDNLELGFGERPLPLKEWLPILEAGWAAMTVGVIPPSLDQVLIGTIDRSRSPDVRLCVVLGLNEGVFPALPRGTQLLTEMERERLVVEDAPFVLSARQLLGHERYFAYIAMTRPSESLCLTWSRVDDRGKTLNASPFVHQLRRLFPDLKTEAFDGQVRWGESEHASELAPAVLRTVAGLRGVGVKGEVEMWEDPVPEPLVSEVSQWPEWSDWVRRATPVLGGGSGGMECLTEETAERLYGKRLRTSISALETFAQCPFRFFVARGLEAEEPEWFEVDSRQRGSFQHEVLKGFHELLKSRGLSWHRISVGQARQWMGEVGVALLPTFEGGLMDANEKHRFVGRRLVERLQDLAECLVEWMPQYGLEPTYVELGFGLGDNALPGWVLPLGQDRELMLRGRLDRVDLVRSPDGSRSYAVVVDYKSSPKSLEELKLQHGLQLQLPAYLLVLQHLSQSGDLNGPPIEPVGGFYVCLRGPGGRVDRHLTVEQRRAERRKAYQHWGRFNLDHRVVLDRRPEVSRGDQFRYSITKAGVPAKRGNDGVSTTEFRRMLARTQQKLTAFGHQIYQGHIEVSPVQVKKEVACDWCDFRAICRFDPWVDHYRVLAPLPEVKDE